jgi:endoglucanase
MKTGFPFKALATAALLFALSVPSQAQAVEDGANLLTNGDFESDKDGDGWPDDWGKLDHGASYETENCNRFFRLTYTKPDEMLLAYCSVALPVGTEALEFSFRARTTDLKIGDKAWFDARVLMSFKDAAGKTVEPSPTALYLRESTSGWTSRSQKLLVPPDATSLEVMPTLFNVKQGQFDLDDITLKAMDAAALKEESAQQEAAKNFLNMAPEAAQIAKWPVTLQVEGNQIIQQGKPIWLQGVNVESLEWTATGENVLRTAQAAIDQWKSNIIRLPVSSEFWFGKDADDGGMAYRKLVDNIITLVANRGAYTLLDLHHFGAPRNRDVEFWKDAAARYKNHPAVVFDLFNEPHSTTWEVWRNGGFVPDKDAPANEDNFLSAEEKALGAKGYHAVGMQKLVDTVRGAGALNMLVIGGLDWAYELAAIDQGFALNDREGHGIVYATHIYPWKKDWEKAFGPIIGKYPVLVGEVGASNKKMEFLPADQQEDANTWVPKILGFIQKHKLHWTAFSFHPTSVPNMLSGWDFTPTPEWGSPAKRALAGEPFPYLGTW